MVLCLGDFKGLAGAALFSRKRDSGSRAQPSHVSWPSFQRKLEFSLLLLDSGSRPAALPGMTNQPY